MMASMFAALGDLTGSPLNLVLAAAVVCGGSGLPALLSAKGSNRGQRLCALISVAGSTLGLWGVVLFLLGDAAPAMSLPWSLPGGSFSVALDGLTALFLAPVFLVSGAGAVYGLGYWRESENPENGRKLRAFYGLLTGSMAVLLIARSSVLFLMGWELMGLAGFFLVATDDRSPSVRQAAWTYLVATQVGTMGLLALFALMRNAAGSFEWGPIGEGALGPWHASAMFLLAVVGFGLKAGIMPFHIWLPSAHASAPSHVSGLLSGVMIKMGIYGIVRVSGYLPRPPLWWGALLVGLGVLSGIVGVASAIGQRDLKRMLADSSIENIGIITLGVGLALVGRSLDAFDWVALGLGGALLHVLNHSVFKSLLFFGAGSVIHAAQTREIDSLGGLGRSMPITCGAFLAGAVAICGLPAFNGFVGELLLYLGLFRAALSSNVTACLLATLAAAGLAMTGALAVACFVRAIGAVFFGAARSEPAAGAHEAPFSMTSVMVLLALLCFGLGVAPICVVPIVDRALGAWAPGGSPPQLAAVAPLAQVSLLALALTALAGLAAVFVRVRAARGRAGAPQPGTWDCGHAGPPSPRLQYTASSTGEMLAGLFRWAVRFDERRPHLKEPFPGPTRYSSQPKEPLLDELVTPFFRRWADRFSRLRVLQRGNIQLYLVYILATLVLATAWAVLSGRWSAP
jgi:hydrogenase-4 component B